MGGMGFLIFEQKKFPAGAMVGFFIVKGSDSAIYENFWKKF